MVVARPQVRIRGALEADREFILSLAPRLAEFGPPPWRSSEEIARGECRTLAAALDSPVSGAELLLAESSDGVPLGFIYLESPLDYFRQTPHAHVGVLAVSEVAEGHGVAGALMRAGEAWARAHGFDTITLNVFAGNARARAFYQRVGYEPETLRYVKRLP